jgi:hypothetical protein
MKAEHCQDCGIEIPKTKYSRRFRAFLCTKCRKHRMWVRMIELSKAREWRLKRREQKRIETIKTKEQLKNGT